LDAAAFLAWRGKAAGLQSARVLLRTLSRHWFRSRFRHERGRFSRIESDAGFKWNSVCGQGMAAAAGALSNAHERNAPGSW